MNEPNDAVDLYVYYHISAHSAEHAGATLAKLRAMQAALAERTGVHGQLARRRDDATTWMEVYPAVRDTPAFELALQQTCEHFGIDGLIEPGLARHIERFIPCV